MARKRQPRPSSPPPFSYHLPDARRIAEEKAGPLAAGQERRLLLRGERDALELQLGQGARLGGGAQGVEDGVGDGGKGDGAEKGWGRSARRVRWGGAPPPGGGAPPLATRAIAPPSSPHASAGAGGRTGREG